MARHYWSPSTRGFYLDDVHGPRKLLTADPNWTPPEQPAQAPGEDPAPAPEAPLVEIDNPETGIPEDAIEITAEEKAALVDGQAGDAKTEGRRIELVDGKVTLVDHPVPEGEEAMANLRATRSMLLAKTDAVVARHRDEKDMGGATTLTDAQFAALLKERQRLRDITEDAAALKDPWKTHLGLLEQLRGK